MNKTENINLEKRLSKALLELLQQKQYTNISVKEVCEQTGVTRTSFYLCFDNLDDCLNYSFEEAIHLIMKPFNYYFSMDKNVYHEFLKTALDEETQGLNLFKQFSQAKDLSIVSTFEEKLSKQVEQSLIQSLKDSDRKYDPLMIDYYLNEFSVNMLGTFKWWLEHPQVDSEKIAKIIFKCCYNGLNSILE